MNCLKPYINQGMIRFFLGAVLGLSPLLGVWAEESHEAAHTSTTPPITHETVVAPAPIVTSVPLPIVHSAEAPKESLPIAASAKGTAASIRKPSSMQEGTMETLKAKEKMQISVSASLRASRGFSARKLDFDRVTSEFTSSTPHLKLSNKLGRGIASVSPELNPTLNDEENNIPSLIDIPSWFGNQVNSEEGATPFFEGLGKPRSKNQRNPASEGSPEDLLNGMEIPLVLVLNGNQFFPQVVHLALGKRYLIQVLNHKDQEGALIIPSFSVQLALPPTEFTAPFILEPTMAGKFRFYCPLSGATGTLFIE